MYSSLVLYIFQFSSVPTTNSYVQTDPIEESVPPASSDKKEPVPDKKEPVPDKKEPVPEKKEPVPEKKEVKTETDSEMQNSSDVDWEAKYKKMLDECEERLEKEYKIKQQKALDDLSERVRETYSQLSLSRIPRDL